MRYKTFSPAKTKQIARSLAAALLRARKPHAHAAVYALSGDLGTGKTTFTQGFFRGLGVRGKITSPTFIFIRHYPFRRARFASLYHVDCYRVKEAREMNGMRFSKIMREPGALMLIEWPERIRKLLPKRTIWITFAHGERENERIIEIPYSFSFASGGHFFDETRRIKRTRQKR